MASSSSPSSSSTQPPTLSPVYSSPFFSLSISTIKKSSALYKTLEIVSLLYISTAAEHLLLLEGCVWPAVHVAAITMEVDELAARRKISLAKVRDTWRSIIKKYSALPPDQQGDVVDLNTGEIVRDRGHLRSLKQPRDNLWAPGSPERAHAAAKGKSIPIIDLDSVSATQPGGRNYVVSSSQHMTRSKVTGNDNLFVRRQRSPPATTTTHTHNSRPISVRSNHDPLNILSSSPALDSPSKVRRLRKALDKPIRHRPLHSLILRNRRSRKSKSPLK